MLSAILLLALMQPQDPGLAAAPAPDTTTAPVRTEKLTPAEVKALADANQAVADAQAPRELFARLGKDHQQASVPQIPDRIGASKCGPQSLDELALDAR